MPQRTLNEVAALWSKRRGDISAAIVGLAEAMARLALHVKLTAAVAHATEVGRAAEALRDAAMCPSGLIFEPEPCGENRYDQAPTVTTSPSDEFDVGRCNLERIEAELVGPEEEIHEFESEIASGILNLHERLGSFIKT
jgi:hypothetical protein